MFFRAQQSTDFNKLKDHLGEISSSVAILRNADKAVESVGLAKELGSIRSSVETLNLNVNHLSGTIIDEVKGQLDILMKSVLNEFDRQIEINQDVLVSTISKELKNVSSNERNEVSNKIAGKFADILRTMGRYQSIVITEQAAVAMNKVEDKVVGAVTEVSEDAKNIQRKVESLPLALPPKA
jgi:hypothetical protein